MRRESALHISACIDLPGLLVRLTNTVNFSSVSLNATSSGVVSLHVSSDRVMVIDLKLGKHLGLLGGEVRLVAIVEEESNYRN